MLKKLFGKKDKSPNKSDTPIQEQAMLNAIQEQKKSYPLAGVKIGSKEVVQRLIDALKNEKGVHVESLLAIIGSLAGYSCHAAFREEIIDTGKHKENEIFTVMSGKDGNNYYFGDLPNKPLVEGQVSIWGLVAGMVQHFGEEIPDVNGIFTHVSSTVGGERFGIPNIPEQHRPSDLPINYVKAMWNPLLPIIDKFCDRPMERPILLGFAAQQVIEMGKGAISPAIAATLIMECAVPMSKVGPEWLS